jgi:hypothetical protein
MNYYFMPRIEGLKCSVTLANFPSVEREVPWSLEQVLHVAWSHHSLWEVRALDTVSPGKSVVCTCDELPSELPDNISPFFFFHPKKLPSTLDRLIISDLMLTSPNWRANIQLSSPTTSTSYQGEYPGSMIGIEKGTMLSLGPLVQLKTGLTSKLILVNLGAKPGNEVGQVRLAQMNKQKILLEVSARRNHCNIIDLSALNCDGYDDPVCVFSNDLTGIPIFLTHDLGFTKMSLEHTHPPAEMLVFGNRGKLQKQMKGWWLSKINRHDNNN